MNNSGAAAACLIALFGAPTEGNEGVKAHAGALLLAETCAHLRKLPHG